MSWLWGWFGFICGFVVGAWFASRPIDTDSEMQRRIERGRE